MATLHFGIHSFAISDDDVAQVREEISGAILSGEPKWLRIDGGYPDSRLHHPADVLITSGVPIAITTDIVPEV